MNDKLKMFSARGLTKIELDDGTPVWLRRLMAFDRIEFNDRLLSHPDKDASFRDNYGLMGCLISYAVCDENGERLFQDGDDRSVLKTFETQEIDTLFDEVQTMNGMGTKGDEDVKKKSPETSTDTTSSTS